MKLKLFKYCFLLIIIAIIFVPFSLHSQSKKIINLSDEEMSQWLGISTDASSESPSSSDSSGMYESTSSAYDEYPKESSTEDYYPSPDIDDRTSAKDYVDPDYAVSTKDGDGSAYSSLIDKYSSDPGSPRSTQKLGKAANVPFFKGGINQIDPVNNEFVKSYIDYFINDEKGREWIEASLRHFEFYFPVFRTQLKFVGLPLELMVIPFVETGYNNEVRVDPNKAGLWQLDEHTARKYNLEMDEYVDERKDFEKATRAAALKLKKLYSNLKDWNLTIMAWAVGEENLIHAANTHRTRDCWKLYEAGAFGKSKRRAFLAHFYALLNIIANAGRYGFTSPRFVKGIPYYKILINKAVELKRMEMDLRLAKDILYAYNPQLTLKMTPPNYKNFLLKIPSDYELKRQFEIQASIYNGMPEHVVKYEPKIKPMEDPKIDEDEGTPLEFSGFENKKAEKLRIEDPYKEEELEEDIGLVSKKDYDKKTKRPYVILGSDRSGDYKTKEDDIASVTIDDDESDDDDEKIKSISISDESDDDIERIYIVEETEDDSYDLVDFDYYDREVYDVGEATKKSSSADLSSMEDEEDREKVYIHDDSLKGKDIIYTVKYGDTLWGLHKKFGVPFQVLAYYNDIKNPNKIYADDVIRIPSESKLDTLIARMESKRTITETRSVSLSDSSDREELSLKDYSDSESTAEDKSKLVFIDDDPVSEGKGAFTDDVDLGLEYTFEGEDSDDELYAISKEDPEYLIYIVKKGDTLISIANSFDISIKNLSLSNPDLSVKILPGQKIKIPM